MPTLKTRLLAGGLTVLLSACEAGTPTEAGTGADLAKAATSSLAVTSTKPAASSRDTTLDVHVLGSGFDRGSQVAFLLNGAQDPKVRTNSTRFVSQGDLVANVTCPCLPGSATRSPPASTTPVSSWGGSPPPVSIAHCGGRPMGAEGTPWN